MTKVNPYYAELNARLRVLCDDFHYATLRAEIAAICRRYTTSS